MIKERKKTSKLWLIDKQELKDYVSKATSISQILIHFGFVKYGRNNATLKQVLDKSGIDYSHIPQGRNSNSFNLRGGITPKTLEEVLTQDSGYSRTHLKKRLIREKILKNECRKCGLGNVWQNEPISLQLEHKNGNGRDNRIENLEILCPNCHSQTTTFAGRKQHQNLSRR